MKSATREALLWGVVGGLSFLVLAQGYELLGTESIGFVLMIPVAVVVGVAAAVTTRLLRARL